MKNIFLQKITLSVVFVCFLFTRVYCQWRGIDRSGNYNEKGLLKQWPKTGPEMLWHTEKLGKGHSSVSFAHNTIYLTGIEGTMDVLYALDMKGTLKWKTPYGEAWMQSYPDSRCTPTVDETNVFVTSGKGVIACINAKKGKIVWARNACEEYEASIHNWGVAESPILVDNKVIFSPIGKKTTTIALNKLTGKTVWESESLNDILAYVSPILVSYAGKKFIVNVSASHIYAVDVSNGKILWKFKYFDVKTPTWHKDAPIINCVTPLYNNGQIYVTSGYNHAGVMLKLNKDATGVELMWADTVLDNHHGGVLKSGDYIYGSNWLSNTNGNWCCIEWKTGKAKYETKWHCKGSIIANDGMLYCYDEKQGNVALVKANPEKFKPVSSFKVPYGRGPHWAHPVIKEGILYIRHGNALMAYNLK